MGAYCAWKGPRDARSRERYRRWYEAHGRDEEVVQRRNAGFRSWYLRTSTRPDRGWSRGRPKYADAAERHAAAMVRQRERRWAEGQRPKGVKPTDPDELREYNRRKRLAWQEANPEKYRGSSGRWRKANPQRATEQARAQGRSWRKANPAKVRAAERRRRARRLGCDGTSTADQLRDRWAMWGDLCWLCGRAATVTDHVKPLAAGGSNWPSNLRPACKWCNSRKGARWPWPDLEAKLDAMRARRCEQVAA